MDLRWEGPVFGYLALSGVSLLTSTVLGSIPAGILLPLFVILGPTAWLLWGFATTPLYLMATAIFAAALAGAAFLSPLKSVSSRIALWFVGALWLLFGLAAWNFSV